MKRLLILNCVIVVFAVLPAATRGEEAAKQVSYSRDVRPILSTNCFKCHGPDDKTREADLRLDQPGSAYSDEDGRSPAIVPGKPAESELVKRILSDDEFTKMPPPESKKTLKPAEIEMLKAWIAQGAKYEQHWAFIEPQRPDIPLQERKVSNEIDNFILAKLEEVGIEPNPPADRYTLVRRVYLDLIGLPPSPEQADAFVQDSRPDDYERLVDELLASPHYGERWARRWLDLARYSDTNGYEKDRPRDMYAYRDWVINALNSGMPFDQFTIEQLAGDMLPGATEQQRIATGFHRNTMINEEGGVDPQEFRFYAMIDRVNTTGTTWLGLTIGCCQCHTHKYDPLTQTEYYQVMAFLNNADEPRIKISDDAVKEQRERIQEQIETYRQQLAGLFPLPPENEQDKNLPVEENQTKYRYQHYKEWLKEQQQSYLSWKAVRPESVATDLPNITILEDKSILVSGDQTKNDIFTVLLKPEEKTITGLRLEALPHESLPFGGPGRATIDAGVEKGGEFFLSEIRFEARQNSGAEWQPLKIASAKHSFARENRSAEFTIDGKSDTGWSVNPRIAERHQAVYQFEQPLQNESGQLELRVRLEHESFHPAGLGRFRLSVTSDERELVAFDRPLEIEELLSKPDSWWTEDNKRTLMRRFLETTPLMKKEQEHLAKLRKSLPDYPTALVMQERQEQFPRITHRHHRGEFLSPREELAPGVPEILHGFPEEARRDRLAFARWLVSRDNPLTARVVMNREWEAFFGRGIVRTTEDFGVQGELPTHPRLLDWLAVEFMESGWSLKHMHKLIVMSDTYRQSSVVTEEADRLDPENKYLSHAPRVRLEAELIRDNALAVSGLLSEKIGGPSVFPPQPPGITEASYGPLQWKVSTGEDRYRRGLYTFNKRTAPYTMFSTFDGPSGEACISRRDPSNTPLQALTMLNSEVMLESAQHLALEIVQSHASSLPDQIEKLFRRVLVRPPTGEELKLLQNYYQSQRSKLQASPLSAREIAGAGQIQRWDFENDTQGWSAVNQSVLQQSNGHLVIESTGDDPFSRTELEAPAGQLTVTVRMNSHQEGQCQFFWTTEQNPADSVERVASFAVKPGWNEYQTAIESESPLKSLRFDPVGAPGTTEVDWIEVSTGSGNRAVPAGIDVNDWAAMTLLARSIMNLDEAITKP